MALGRIEPAEHSGAAEQVAGTVVSVQREECAEELADDVNGCGSAQVRLTGEGAEERDLEVPLPNGPGTPEVAEGDDVVLIQTVSPDGKAYAIVDHQRSTGLWVVVGAFALAVVAFGRWRGVAALAGLAVTFALLVFFVVPAILAGEPPLLVAIVGSAAIMLTVLYLTHGLTLSPTVAVLGTLAALTLTGLLSLAAVSDLHLTAITDDISTSLGTVHSVNMEGLLLAGIVLAYAGSSLPLLILIVATNDSLGGVVTDQIIAQEIVRSAVATLGLIAAVQVTTALAAFTAGRTAEAPD